MWFGSCCQVHSVVAPCTYYNCCSSVYIDPPRKGARADKRRMRLSYGLTFPAVSYSYLLLFTEFWSSLRKVKVPNWSRSISVGVTRQGAQYNRGAEKAPRPNLEPTQWVLRALCSSVKLSGHDADHLTPYSVEIKNYTAAPPYAIMECTETGFEDAKSPYF